MENRCTKNGRSSNNIAILTASIRHVEIARRFVYKVQTSPYKESFEHLNFVMMISLYFRYCEGCDSRFFFLEICTLLTSEAANLQKKNVSGSL